MQYVTPYNGVGNITSFTSNSPCFDMNLVGKAKLLAYIEKEPKAKTDILVWIKSFTSGNEKFHRKSEMSGISYCSCSPGAGEYTVKYTYIGALQCGVVDFVGDKQDLHKLHEREHLLMIARHPDEKIISEKITITGGRTKSVVTPINPTAAELNTGLKYLEEEANHPYRNFRYSTDFTIQTSEDYEMALYRLINAFKPYSAEPNLAEATALISLLKDYEDKNLKFPDLDLMEVLRREMSLRQEQPIDLARFFDCAEDALLFFDHKKGITKKTLKALCKRYRIDFIYNELLDSARSSGIFL